MQYFLGYLTGMLIMFIIASSQLEKGAVQLPFSDNSFNCKEVNNK
jgi:hypothetical protein